MDITRRNLLRVAAATGIAAVMRHERRRQDMGKRGHVTASEVFARVAEGPVEPVSVTPGVAIETYAC